MPRKQDRVRLERGLYRSGNLYFACATPMGSRKVVWKKLGAVGVMEARRLRDEFAAETRRAPAAPRSRRVTEFPRFTTPLNLARSPRSPGNRRYGRVLIAPASRPFTRSTTRSSDGRDVALLPQLLDRTRHTSRTVHRCGACFDPLRGRAR